jgi:hypothetical protein
MINRLNQEFCSVFTAIIGAWLLLKSLNSNSLRPQLESWATPTHLLGAALGAAFLFQSYLLAKQFLSDK